MKNLKRMSLFVMAALIAGQAMAMDEKLEQEKKPLMEFTGVAQSSEIKNDAQEALKKRMYSEELACEDLNKVHEKIGAAKKLEAKWDKRMLGCVIGFFGFVVAGTLSLALEQKFKEAGPFGLGCSLAGLFVTFPGFVFCSEKSINALLSYISLRSRRRDIYQAQQRRLIFNKKLQGENVDAAKVLGELVVQLNEIDTKIQGKNFPVEEHYKNCEELFVKEGKEDKEGKKGKKEKLFYCLRSNAQAMLRISLYNDADKKYKEIVSKKA